MGIRRSILILAILFLTAGLTVAETGYVANFDDGTLSVINPDSGNAVTNTLTPNGTNPFEGVVVLEHERAFFSMQGTSTTPGNSVAVVDLRDGVMETDITGFDFPSGMAVDPDGDAVYVVDTGNLRVVAIDPLTLTTIDTWSLPVGTAVPYDILVSEDGDHLYVSDRDSNNATPYGIHHIDLLNDTVDTLRHASISDPTFMAMGPNEDWLYVSCLGNDNVVRIDMSDFSYDNGISFGADAAPLGIAVHPDSVTARVYVALAGDNEVKVINTTTFAVVNTIAGFNGAPGQITMLDDGTSFYVGNISDPAVVVSPSEKEVYVVSTTTESITQTFEAGRVPFFVLIHEDLPPEQQVGNSPDPDSNDSGCLISSGQDTNVAWMLFFAVGLLAAASLAKP